MDRDRSDVNRGYPDLALNPNPELGHDPGLFYAKSKFYLFYLISYRKYQYCNDLLIFTNSIYKTIHTLCIWLFELDLGCVEFRSFFGKRLNIFHWQYYHAVALRRFMLNRCNNDIEVEVRADILSGVSRLVGFQYLHNTHYPTMGCSEQQVF